MAFLPRRSRGLKVVVLLAWSLSAYHPHPLIIRRWNFIFEQSFVSSFLLSWMMVQNFLRASSSTSSSSMMMKTMKRRRQTDRTLTLTYFIKGIISVQLVLSLSGLHYTKKENICLIVCTKLPNPNQSTGDQSQSDSSLHWVLSG